MPRVNYIDEWIQTEINAAYVETMNNEIGSTRNGDSETIVVLSIAMLIILILILILKSNKLKALMRVIITIYL